MPRESSASTRAPRAVNRYCSDQTHGLVHDLLERAGDRWTLLVLEVLLPGPARFTAILESVPRISHRMLTSTLRRIERDGLIARVVYPEMPPRVEYELTPLGKDFITLLGGVVAWAETHADEIEESRARFDG